MVNDVFKKTAEEDLKEIKKCKLDVLILQRQNEELCKRNNEEIARLNNVISNRELSLEENLKQSGERKIETSAGWCAYRAMQDKWNYDDSVLIDWAKKDEGRKAVMIRIKEEFNKEQLKDEIKAGLLKVKDVPGLTITLQEPAFHYKLSGGL